MKCQYHAVTSTTMLRVFNERCSSDAMPATIRASTPPSKWAACAPVSKYTKELLGVVAT